MAKTILIIGNCGTGKTWVAKNLIDKLNTKDYMKVGMFDMRINNVNGIAIIGRYEGNKFDGSDRLSMAAMKDITKLKEFCESNNITLIAEGDRVTNSTFINAMRPTIIKILGDGASGRILRGTNQTQRQIKAISTRISKINATHNVMTSNECIHLIETII